MTEGEWLACTDLERMMAFLQGLISERKLMLFGCACCYRQWSVIPDGRCKNAVEIAERFADGFCNSTELRQARDRVEQEHSDLFHDLDYNLHAQAASLFAAFDAEAAREWGA